MPSVFDRENPGYEREQGQGDVLGFEIHFWFLIYIDQFETDCKIVKWLTGDKMKKIKNAYQVALKKIERDLYRLYNQSDSWEIKFIVTKH